MRTQRGEASCEPGRCPSPDSVSAPWSWTSQPTELVYKPLTQAGAFCDSSPKGLREPPINFLHIVAKVLLKRKMRLVLACLKYSITLRKSLTPSLIPRALWSDPVPSRLLAHHSPSQWPGPGLLNSFRHSWAARGPRLPWLVVELSS